MIRPYSKYLACCVIFLFTICMGCSKTSSDEESVRATMNKWKQAIVAQNVDAIAACYSENFTSMDGDGRSGVREMWTEIK